MSITCGFYDSLDGDRKYNAEQMSAMFDGLITDGIFATIGTAMVVTASSGTTVNVGIGKAWFNHTWTVNDAPLAVELSAAETVLDRIDAVVLEIDASSLVRANSVKVIEGTAASSPARPTLTNEGKVHQYALAYIYRTAGSKSISQSDITSMVGTDDTPFVTAILETVSLDELLGQWRDELDQFVANKSAEVDTWTANEEADFTTWFDNVKGQLSEDAAGHLQNEIDGMHVEKTATLSVWTKVTEDYYCTVTVSGVTASNKIIVSAQPTAEMNKLWNRYGVYAASQAANSITFRAKREPDVDIIANVLIIN
jgi:hypothetical protein